MTPSAAPGRRRAGAGMLVLAMALLSGGLLLSGETPAAAAPPVIDHPLAGSTLPGSSFTASGTSDEPAEITVRMNADASDRCTIPPSTGSWTWECTVTGLSGGAQTLRVIQNGVEHSVSFTLEGAPLLLEFPADGGVVYGSLTGARGTADAGDSIFVEIDGAPWCPTGPPASPSGAWSCGGAAVTAAGPHAFSVSQGSRSLAGSFELRSQLPAPAIDSPGGRVERDAAALAGGLTVTGTGTYYSEEPVAVTASLYAVPYTPGDPSLQDCATTPTSGGGWSCTFAAVPPDGSYALGVSQSLSATGPTSGAVVPLSVDSTVPPSAPAAPPASGAPASAPARSAAGVEEPEPEEPAEAEPTAAAPEPRDPAPVSGEPVPAAEPAAPPADVRPGTGWDDPTVVGSTLRTIAETDLGPPALGAAFGVAAGLILLVVLPSRLLDSTVRANYARVFGWLEPVTASRRRFRAAMAASRRLRWSVTGALLLLSAVTLGFTDPHFGLNEASVRLTIALLVSIAAIGLLRGWATGTLARRWWSVGWSYAVRPGGLILLLVGVLVTRMLGLEPGIILGVWLGASLAARLSVAREGRLVLVTTAMVAALGLASWTGYSLVTPLARAEPGFGILLAQEILSTLTLKSLAAFVVLLLPLAFLDGLALWRWSRLLWLVSYAALAVVFSLVVLPLPHRWTELGSPTVLLLAVFGSFTLLSCAVWAWFRFRPAPASRSPR